MRPGTSALLYALMVAAVNDELSNPAKPRAEYDPAKLEALMKRCTDAGIDILDLGERCRGDSHTLARMAEAALAKLSQAHSDPLAELKARLVKEPGHHPLVQLAPQRAPLGPSERRAKRIRKQKSHQVRRQRKSSCGW
jgi:hypothetical protein